MIKIKFGGIKWRSAAIAFVAAICAGVSVCAYEQTEPVTIKTLLEEIIDPSANARLPRPPYRSLQASSYNRLSTHRTQVQQDTRGWFADSDGIGFIRTEKINGRTEWVMMEHDGPGVITKIWTPFFYYGFGDLTGPAVRFYLDGSETSVIDESLIKLVLGQGSVKTSPFAAETARAGNLYLPIPFARSCKITMTRKPFYNIINYRAYPEGTQIQSFEVADLKKYAEEIQLSARVLYKADPYPVAEKIEKKCSVKPGASESITLPEGPAALAWFRIKSTPEKPGDKRYLRSTVLAMKCGDEETVWTPVGDFFSCADSIHPYHTWQRTVAGDGTMTCHWPMPYPGNAELKIVNLGGESVAVDLLLGISDWTWDERSLFFHASWRPDELVCGAKFQDWNFIDIHGEGIFAGDSWTVLNPTHGWWGEGDEKIYVDGAWERGFPTHFGTGTEDYYGWAGGRVPTRADEFDEPFLANVRVGGTNSRHTRGYNICVRTRGLDAIPFKERLRFEMEASAGTGQRKPTDFLGYSAVTFWYARPGAEHNQPPRPKAAAKPIMNLDDIAAKSAGAFGTPVFSEGVEFELLTPTAVSAGLSAGPQRPAAIFNPRQWSGSAHYFAAARKAGDFVEFTMTEQFQPKHVILRVTTSYDFGVVRISINGEKPAERLDLFSGKPAVKKIDFGIVEPMSNAFVIRCELLEPNPRSRGARTYFGLDSILILDAKD